MEHKSIEVLVVEDNAHLLILVKKILEGINCKVWTAENGFEGFKILRHQTDINILLLDIMMPEMSGLEFLKKLDNIQRDDDLTVCMITAKSDDKMIRECLRTGADDYLIKPIDRNILIEKILVLGGRRRTEHYASIATSFKGIMKRLNSNIDVQVISLSEIGMTFESPIRLHENSKVMMEASQLDKIFRKTGQIYLRSTSCEYDGESLYKIKARFLALDENSYRFLKVVTVQGMNFA